MHVSDAEDPQAKYEVYITHDFDTPFTPYLRDVIGIGTARNQYARATGGYRKDACPFHVFLEAGGDHVPAQDLKLIDTQKAPLPKGALTFDTKVLMPTEK